MTLCMRLVTVFATASTSFAVSAQSFRIPTPWGDVRGDLGSVSTTLNGVTNPMGIPTATSLAAYVVQHPDQLLTLTQKPLDAVYLPVANAIESGRNAALASGARRIPAHVKSALRGFYSDELLDSVRWSTDWNAVRNTLQAAQMWANKDTEAITLMNVIMFRDSRAADDVSTWAHELHHVKQYSEWGVLEFAKRWVDNSSVTGPVEAPAYDAQRTIAAALNSNATPRVQPIATGAECFSPNASTAYCDLWTANSETYATFEVAGDALATSDGTRRGRMQLIMLSSGAACNSAASAVEKVDNETRLRGPGYVCRVVVPRGMTARVTLVAPNSRADASYTRATASKS